VTEAAVILWTGVAVGLVGLAATASNGLALLIRGLRERITVVWRWRRKAAPVVLVADPDGAFGRERTFAAFPTLIPPPDASVEMQLDAIRANYDSLQERVRHLEGETRSRHESVAGSVAAIHSNLSTLTTRIDREQINAALVDARGFGPLAFGFVMTAVPHPLASVSLFGALFTAAALVVTAGVGSLVFPNMLRASAP
jgi:hypothetical protein